MAPQDPTDRADRDPTDADESAAPQDRPAEGDSPAGAAPLSAAERTLAAERDDLLARLQRVSADYLNYQKRVRREMDEARHFANADLIRELLAVMDDMDRALEAGEANHPEEDPLLVGMALVHRKALDLLERYGLKRIEAAGQPFDPTRHQAIMQQPSAEYAAPTVLQELQRGYELHGRVLRPAQVVVSAPAEAEED